MTDPILSIRHLSVRYGGVHALDNVSLDVYPGEILGLVGESGCGKTTLARSILRLNRPQSGRILFRGMDLITMRDLGPFRRDVQMIFQHPYGAFDPRMRIVASIAEPLRVLKQRGNAAERVREVMELTGLDPALGARYPHELSIGECQRAALARALAADPVMIIADEPLSSLDVSIQAQILNLLKDLQRRVGLTLLFISHDLRAIQYIAGRVAVMYLGEVVESAPAAELYRNPCMPYTEALISAIPSLHPESARRRAALAADVPSAIDPPSGCRFRTRCPLAKTECAEIKPPLRQVAPGHWSACIRGWHALF